MVSSARFARLGLLAVCLTFGSCMWILGGRAVDRFRVEGWKLEPIVPVQPAVPETLAEAGRSPLGPAQEAGI
jgi:hypothetical protein